MCQSLFLLYHIETSQLICYANELTGFYMMGKKGTLVLVFSCKFCKIFKNIFFTEHVWAATSALIPPLFHINPFVSGFNCRT